MRKRVLAICAAAAGLWAGVVRAQSAADVPDHVPAWPPPTNAAFDLLPLPPQGELPRDPLLGSPPGLLFTSPADGLTRPAWLAAVESPPSVYPDSAPRRTEESINSGGVNFGLDVDWLTDYVYRGIDQTNPTLRSENALQFNAEAKFNLGKLPHPFIGLFVNVFNNDPISRFEEVRPYFGVDWELKPITVTAGFNSYIHPNRKNLDTQEVYTALTLDDSRIFRTPKPIFSPYIYGAYDIDLYNGFYLEAGGKHDFVFEDIGLILTPRADIAYVVDDAYFQKTTTGKNYGLQHYDVGLEARVSLNHLFNVDRRYGQWSAKGYMYYTSAIDKMIRADTLIWGGVGLEFKY